jgi:hypothetical protein
MYNNTFFIIKILKNSQLYDTFVSKSSSLKCKEHTAIVAKACAGAGGECEYGGGGRECEFNCNGGVS